MVKFNYAIIDIESYLHNACIACKTLQALPNQVGVYTEVYDLKLGIDYIDKIINGFLDQLQARQEVLVIGDKDNFRKELNPLYKSHRGAKPLMYDMMVDYIIGKYKVISLKNLEADDTIRIIYEDDANFKGEKIIVTIDKDFYSVPCTLYRDNIKDREVVTVTEEDARVNEYVQVIMGDKTDGYVGIPNYGEAKARRFVTSSTTWDDIVQLYKDNGLTEDDANINYNMAHIVGFRDYNMLAGNVNIKKGRDK